MSSRRVYSIICEVIIDNKLYEYSTGKTIVFEEVRKVFKPVKDAFGSISLNINEGVDFATFLGLIDVLKFWGYLTIFQSGDENDEESQLKKISDFEDKNKKLTERNIALETKQEDHENEKASLEKDRDNLLEKLNNLLEKHDFASRQEKEATRWEKLAKRFKSLYEREKESNKKKTVGVQGKKMEEFKKRYQDQNDEIRRNEGKYSLMNDTLLMKEKTIEANNTKLKKVSGDLKLKKSAIRRLQHEKSTLEKEIEAGKKNYAKMIAKIRKECDKKVKGDAEKKDRLIVQWCRDASKNEAIINSLKLEEKKSEDRHTKQIVEMTKKWDSEKSVIVSDFNTRLTSLRLRYDREIERIQTTNQASIRIMKKEHMNEIRKYVEEYRELDKRTKDEIRKIKKEEKDELEKLEERFDSQIAQIVGAYHNASQEKEKLMKEMKERSVGMEEELARVGKELVGAKEKLERKLYSPNRIDNRVINGLQTVMNSFNLDITPRVHLTRIDILLRDAQEEEFWSFDPTKFASIEGKLEYYHDISRFKFICKFQEEKSKYREFESYLERPLREVFENVVVDRSKDDNLRVFSDDFREKFKYRVKNELQNKEKESVANLMTIIKEMILCVVEFFKIPSSFLSLDRKRLKKTITNSLEKRGGNNTYLGDLKGECGYCRHHATMFKFACDLVGIRCKMEIVYSYHAWNIVQIKDNFFLVDITNFKDKIIDVEEYYKKLKNSLSQRRKALEENSRDRPLDRFNLDMNKKIMGSIDKVLVEKKKEKLKVLRMKDYVNGKRTEEFTIARRGKKGGSGDIQIYRIDKTVKGESEDSHLFEKGDLVAIKMIEIGFDFLPGYNQHEKMSYVNREVSHMKILDHPSIIPVLGHWDEIEEITGSTCVFIAMKGMHLDGKEFLSKLCNTTHLSLRKKEEEEESEGEEEKKKKKMMFSIAELNMKKRVEVLVFLLETARGLRYLSKMNITHLDMKLQNVVIEWDEEKNEISDVRIIDFGGAKNNGVKTSNFFTTLGYDSPEIKQEKLVKEIRMKVSEFEEKIQRSENAQNLFRQLESKFQELTDSKLSQLEKEFENFLRLQKRKKNLLNFSLPQWGDQMRKRVGRGKLLSGAVGREENENAFDCRADIFSFGVMMEKFLSAKFMPHELVFLIERCKEEDRRDRPTWDEIVFVLRNHLSFYNEKMKEEEMKNKLK